MLILLKWPCSVPHLFKIYRNEFSRFFTVVEVYFRTEKSEMMRSKLDLNQDVLQGSQQNKNPHGSEVKYFTLGKQYGFSFVAVNNTPKAIKSPVPNSQRFYLLVLKVFYSNKTQRKSVLSEKPV